jgi:hypothetical protein
VSRTQSHGGAHNEAAFNQRSHIAHSTVESTLRRQCIGVAGARMTNIPSILVDWADQKGGCMNEAVGRRVGTGNNFPDRCRHIASCDAVAILGGVSSMRTSANRSETSTSKQVTYGSSSTPRRSAWSLFSSRSHCKLRNTTSRNHMQRFLVPSGSRYMMPTSFPYHDRVL